MSKMPGQNNSPRNDLWNDPYENLEDDSVFWKAWLDPPTEAVIIRIAIFDHCTCAAVSDKHYSVRFKYDDVTKASAAAISYIWGDFNRKEIQVGHVYDKVTHGLSMYLGAEWNKTNFLDRLVQLSREYGGCWIDQFCVPQKDDTISEALAKVPSIYKSLSVVIIWPASLCPCLKDALDEWVARYEALSVMPRSKSATKIYSPRFQEIREAFEEARNHLYGVLRGYRCFNSCGANSWASRIWPDQEFRYANRLRLVFADALPAPCTLGDGENKNRTQFESFSRPLEYHLVKLYKQGFSAEEIAAEFRSFCENFADKMEIMLETNFSGQSDLNDSGVIKAFEYPECFNFDSYVVLNRLERHARFLLGHSISIDSDFRAEAVFDVLNTCERLRAARLEATQPKDLILSVWSGSRHYRPPQGIMTQGPWWLLCDVFRQINEREPGKHLFVPTYWPAGLFGEEEGSAEWRPDIYMPTHDPRDTKELYGPFLWSGSLWMDLSLGSNLRIPLQVNHSNSKKKIFTLEEIGAEMQSWAQETTITTINGMLDFLGVKGARSNFGNTTDTSGAVNLRAYLHDLGLIKRSALLDLATLQGIDLMFTWRTIRDRQRSDSSEEEPLVWKRILVVGLVNTKRLQQVRTSKATTITIASRMSRWGWIYEAANVGADEYSVFGIWLPSRDTYPAWERFEETIEETAEAFMASTKRGGYIDKFVQNAWLV